MLENEVYCDACGKLVRISKPDVISHSVQGKNICSDCSHRIICPDCYITPGIEETLELDEIDSYKDADKV